MEQYQSGTARTFARQLRELREKRGLSQAALARATGLDTGYLTRCEQGQRVPANVDTVESLAAALDCAESETDALRIAAGFLPRAIQQLGLDDPELLLLAQLLAPAELPAATRDVIRRVIRSFQPLLAPGDVLGPAPEGSPITAPPTDRGSGSPDTAVRPTTRVKDPPGATAQPAPSARARPGGRRRPPRVESART
jgi:transcriptional regulator with XRE-family HTH domain